MSETCTEIEDEVSRSPTVASSGRTEKQLAARVLVLGDEIGVFLAVARSLGRRGIEVHVAPTDGTSPGLKSRYVAKTHMLPPYHAGSSAWLEALRTLVCRYDYKLILPCSDSGLLILDHHAADLGREILAIPNHLALDVFTDKVRTRALAQSLDVPVAQGGLTDGDTRATELADELRLPLVLKPRTSYVLRSYYTKRTATIVRAIGPLEQALSAPPPGGWLAEAFFPGDGIGVSVLADAGRVLLSLQHRRLRAFSEVGGSTVRMAEPLDPQLLADVRSLVKATALSGVAMFEFRQDAGSGSYILLEVNPRFWGSLPLAVAAGADFPALLWDMSTEGLREIGPMHPTAMRKRNLSGELDRLAGEFATRGFAGKIGSIGELMLFAGTLLAPPLFDSWAADDPAPFRAERRQVARRLARGLVKRLRD